MLDLVRRRVAWLLPFQIGILIWSCLTAAGVEVASLGELVPWPMLSAGITGVALELTSRPTESVVVGELADSARFGLLRLGTGPDPGVTIAIVEDGDRAPLLLLDADNNEDLTNNEWVPVGEKAGARSFTWFATVFVEYNSDEGRSRVPYHIAVSARFSYALNGYAYNYGGFCHRRGVASLSGELYLVAVTSMSSDAVYSELSHLIVAVDVDRDGTLDTLPSSHENFGPGEALETPSGRYQIVWMSEDGQQLHLVRIDDGSSRPRIARGEEAPRFETTSLAGDHVVMPSDSKKVSVLLLVEGPDVDSECASCASPGVAAGASARIQDVYNHISDLLEEVSLYVVFESDPGLEPELDIPPAAPIHLIWDPAINRLYRRSGGAFVVDRSGYIVAMDEAWVTMLGRSRPRGGIDVLRSFDIRMAVLGLLQEGEED